MASIPNNINLSPTVAIDGSTVASGFGGNGSLSILLSIDTVGASVTAGVQAKLQMPFKARVRAVPYSNAAITGTASFDLYNNTDSALVIASTALASATPGTVTSISNEFVDKGDEIRLRVTTAAASSITNLLVWLIVDQLGDADNPLPNTLTL